MNSHINKSIDLDRLKESLLSIGFPDDEADTQLANLCEVISLSIASRISTEILRQDTIDWQMIEQYVVENPDNKDLVKIFAGEPAIVVENYLKEITVALPDEKRKEVLEKNNFQFEA